jgi:hypothetical protein
MPALVSKPSVATECGKRASLILDPGFGGHHSFAVPDLPRGCRSDTNPNTRDRYAMSPNDEIDHDDPGSAHAPDRSVAPHLLRRKSVLMGILTSGFVIANAAKSSNASAGTVKPSTIAASPPPYDAVIRWNGSTGSQPLRSSVTTSASQRVRWVQPTQPPVTKGYAIAGDVWERSV